MSLLVPLMNISGKAAVLAMKSSLNSPNPAAMVVLHDSLERKVKAVSPKFGGSAAGHNGLRDIIKSLGGNMDFHRIRLGIGRPDGGNVADYVLGRLSQEEKAWWGASGQGTDLVWREIEKILAGG
jgi:peptidyl-tRNA hydrolase, PTH1 family